MPQEINMARNRYRGYFWYEPTTPRAVRGGIKAQTRRGGFVREWWGKRWIEVLESFQIGARLVRGRSYARRGQVADLDIRKGGNPCKGAGLPVRGLSGHYTAETYQPARMEKNCREPEKAPYPPGPPPFRQHAPGHGGDFRRKQTDSFPGKARRTFVPNVPARTGPIPVSISQRSITSWPNSLTMTPFSFSGSGAWDGRPFSNYSKKGH